MAELAILGHATRGKEVIKTLEMLGGINKTEYIGNKVFAYYFINDNYIDWCHESSPYDPESNFISFTLEEFLKKYPYKVGDKVLINDDFNDVYTIKSMIWDMIRDCVGYRIEAIDGVENDHLWYAYEMTFYSEQKEKTTEKIKIDIPTGYEFVGIDDNTQQVVFQKIRPEYPKTCEECLSILGKTMNSLDRMNGYKFGELMRFQQLLICRDAYWKIAGEQLRLDKPWEYDMSKDEFSYAISYQYGHIQKNEIRHKNAIFAFPTAEIRDAFKENFDDDIDACKEFL